MENYYSESDSTGKPTGVKGYDYGADYIKIYFTSGTWYRYTYDSAGSDHIETMKALADGQHGLNTYVTKNKPDYDSKG